MMMMMKKRNLKEEEEIKYIVGIFMAPVEKKKMIFNRTNVDDDERLNQTFCFRLVHTWFNVDCDL